MSDRSTTYLKDRRTGQMVEAMLIDGVSREDVERAESSWRPALDQNLAELKRSGVRKGPWPEHGHWDWRKKREAIEGLIAYRMFGVECEGEMQGLMLVSTAGHPCRITEQKGKEQVYIDFVASAPWNSPGLVESPRYGLVGRVLIATAVHVSLDEGFRGRIGLHSLPQAETFYAANCGMTDLGKDMKKEGLRYFEMTSAQSAAFLR
ncbi:MAG: GNAT family N-acetyltransferase [Acidobacteriota bacterium]|nr:GNAT family N-acetyltransferase [Acidobacteriota bacterium]